MAAGAGGHAGTMSPFALVQEMREWFDGPIALSGAIATGRAIRAARSWAPTSPTSARPSSPPRRPTRVEAYKQMIVASRRDDIVYSSLFTGVHGNYLKPSIVAAGLDPDNLPTGDPSKMNFGTSRRAQQAEGLEGHLGLRPGHRRHRQGAAGCRTDRAVQEGI